MRMQTVCAVVVLGLAACSQAYPPPGALGLVAVRAYPGDGDVCQVIGEGPATIDYLDDAALLVGCPAVETGAIADRVAQGGTVVGEVGDWVLLSIRLR